MNIEDEEVLENTFNNARIIFNKENGCNNILGKKVSTTKQVLRAVDIRVSDLLHYSLDWVFEDLEVLDVVKYNPNIENYWFSKKFYSDTPEGLNLMTELLYKIMKHDNK
jgi:hypothetical protein